MIAQERRLRRLARNRGMRIERKNDRWHGLGYQLIENNIVKLGCRQHECDATLDEIERYLEKVAER